MKTILTLKVSLLAALARFISADETRYVLNGVCVKMNRGKPIQLAATDGRRMARITFKEHKAEVAADHQFIIPSDAVRGAVAAFGGTDHFPCEIHYEQETGLVTLMRADGTHPCTIKITQHQIEGNFPNYDLVIPDPIPTEFAEEKGFGYNYNFLADCALLAEHVAAKTHASHIGRRAGDGVLVFVCDSNPEMALVCVMMPMRTS